MNKWYSIAFLIAFFFIIGIRVYASNIFTTLNHKDEPSIQIVDSKGRMVEIPAL